MSFIGVISDSNDFEFIKNELNKEDLKLQLIYINENNIDNMKNIKFETIVICNDINKMENKKSILKPLLKNTKHIVINADSTLMHRVYIGDEIEKITYGMSRKSIVTASSIKDDEILICFQKNIKSIRGNIIEIQEFKIKTDNITNKKVYNLLVIATLKKLYE